MADEDRRLGDNRAEGTGDVWGSWKRTIRGKNP